MSEVDRSFDKIPRWVVFLTLLGVYLTLRGYHSRDGDQAYRLPLLLHRQDPQLFQDDPFVRAFDVFNPHRGYLALLDAASRPFGLSVGLFGLFALTFFLTCHAIERLGRWIWPELGRGVGFVAVILFLAADAGNIGTNHLFEAMLLDRLMALALGWLALGHVVSPSRRGPWIASGCLGLAAWIHPSMGLQLAMLVGSCWVLLDPWPGQGEELVQGSSTWNGARVRRLVVALAILGLALYPSLAGMFAQGRRLFEGLDPEEFYLLSARVQGPQHMIPHLWRFPQWLAWFCYPMLAGWTLFQGGMGPGTNRVSWPLARRRVVVILGIVLLGLMVAGAGIEGGRDLRLILFQPFRMATVARGLCVLILAGWVRALWQRGTWFGRARATLLVAGLSGDWAMVVACSVELATSAAERFPLQRPELVWGALLGLGLRFLSRNDTESGHDYLLGVLLGVGLIHGLVWGRAIVWSRPRQARIVAYAWTLPVLAMVLPPIFDAGGRPMPAWVTKLASHCRFGAWPVDSVERLAVWCREQTPRNARFIGPPGPKTFRLWSLRSVAFNRAASPYHAAGLADWASRFRQHVAFQGSTAAFARAYLTDRKALEQRFDDLRPMELAALARRQGASYILARAPIGPPEKDGPMELLHIDGDYAVYRVRPQFDPDQAPATDAYQIAGRESRREPSSRR